MRALINLGGFTSWLNSSKMLGIVLKVVLESLVTVNQVFLSKYKVKPLYESGVRYRNEPEGKIIYIPEHSGIVDKKFGERITGKFEDFATIPVMLERGWGDCDDLAPWRCAELRMKGERAKIRVQWKRIKGVKMFHIVVRRADGSIEDPSKILGMNEPKWKNPRLYM